MNAVAHTRSRLPGLDGLRALAALAVVIFHADSRLLPGGFLGVDLFFVISGYLITRLLLSELGFTGRIDLPGFYLRRVFRLMPALLVVLAAVTVAVAVGWRDELPTLRGSVVSSLTYVGNWWLIDAHQSYFVASGRPPMLQHLWSLAIEEQFYLLWPILLLLSSSRRRRFGWVAGIAVGLGLASTATMAVIATRSGVPYAADSSRIYFGTDTHAMGLLVGAGMGALAERLAFQPRRSWRVRPWATDLLGVTGLAGLGWMVYHVNEFSQGLYRGGFLAASGLAVLAVATVARPTSHLGRLLDRQPLRWLGDRSYAIYLWHWPVVVVTRPGVDLTVDRWLVDGIRLLLPLVLAELSYRLIERPARRAGAAWLRRRGDPQWRPVRAFVPRLLSMTALAAVLLTVVVVPTAHPRPAAALSGVPSDPARESAEPGGVGAGPAGVGAEPADGVGAGPLRGAGSIARARPPRASRSPAAASPARSVSRSSPKPSRAAPTSLPGITAFGDSVMLGAQPAIAAAFPRSQVHAVEGRQPYVTLQDVRDQQAAHTLEQVVVIHTGNNGIIRASDLSQTLAALRDRRRVVLLTDRVPMDWQDPNNRTIKQVAARFGNVTVLDWYAQANGNQSWFYADGLHLRSPGAVQYARLLAQVMGH